MVTRPDNPAPSGDEPAGRKPGGAGPLRVFVYVGVFLVAIVAASTVSGADLDLLAVARNKHPERASGMEARIGAEAGHVVAWQGMTREQVNEIVKQLLAEYEDKIEQAPLGKRFDECYDLPRVQPTQEYLDLYDRCKEGLTKLGLDYSLL